MTIIRVRSRRQMRNREATAPEALTLISPPRGGDRSRVGTVDRLTGRDRGDLPLTDLQRQVLDALTAEPSAIAARADLEPGQVGSAVLYLPAKGYATRTKWPVAAGRRQGGNLTDA